MIDEKPTRRVGLRKGLEVAPEKTSKDGGIAAAARRNKRFRGPLGIITLAIAASLIAVAVWGFLHLF